MKEKYMKLALKEAEKAFSDGEVPIGAVIVYNDKVIARGHNQKEKNNKVSSHAEMIAIEKAEKKLKNWRLDDCDIYVTLEPCPMCASAIQQSRIRKVYCSLKNQDETIHKLFLKIVNKNNTNNSVEYEFNILEKESLQLLTQFFTIRRNKQMF